MHGNRSGTKSHKENIFLHLNIIQTFHYLIIMMLSIQRLTPEAILPSRGSKHAAGLDVYSPQAYTLPPGQRVLIPLDISIELPIGTFAHLLPRSGLALKHGIHVGAGVVDSDYRGNVSVLLMNLGEEVVHIQAGDRIAQMVVLPCLLMEVNEVHQTTVSDRGTGGFGSTGK